MARHRQADYLTDEEAGAGARTGTRARNLEESAATPAPPSGGHCAHCHPLPALPDPRGTHECARCRRVLVAEYAERRERERAAERQKRADADALRR